MSDEQRDALARIINPTDWDLYDRILDVNKPKIAEAVVVDSRKIADRIVESGIMVSMKWERREYYAAVERVKRSTSITGRCFDVDDLMDGYFVHDPKCMYWPDSAIGGSNCIK